MDIPALLSSARVIAVVGLSDNPDRSSFGVAQYLRDAGYRIIPVNPAIAEWQGIPSVASLREIVEPVDIVDIFRRPEFVTDIVDDAISIGARAVWMQQGIRNDEAARKAEAAGLIVIQDRCIALEHSKFRQR
jgi:predicted CoA-binding protein